MRSLVLALWTTAVLVCAPLAMAGQIGTSVDPATITGGKATDLGLYMTSEDAADAVVADPSIIFVDVRTRAEFQFVGHPDPVDANIPFGLFDPEYIYNGKSAYGMRSNPDFVSRIDALVARLGKTRTDPVLVICRSGGRSAAAANALAKAGYTNVWSVVDGFEGGKDPATGHRTRDGWRNRGLPWGYAVSPELTYAEGG